MSGVNEQYLFELLQRYSEAPHSVDQGWHDLLSVLADEIEEPSASDNLTWNQNNNIINPTSSVGTKTLSDHIIESNHKPDDTLTALLAHLQNNGYQTGEVQTNRAALLDSIRAIMLIRAYRMVGHYKARLDPLELVHGDDLAELNPETYGFGESDMDRVIFINHYLGLEQASLRDIIAICEQAYCSTIGIEFLHIQNIDEKRWLQEKIESSALQSNFSNKGKIAILERLKHADLFESFLDVKYKGAKRFGLDGAETLVPMIEQILKRGSQLGLEEVVLGMAHRGRLNVLANIMHKPYKAIFAEFQGKMAHDDIAFSSGDVKYHLGASANRVFDDKTIHLSLTPNPSHLEAVNTVVLGKVKAKQIQRRDYSHEKVMGLLLHGDAAFIGQGIVAETFLLSQLEGYQTGGTIHIAINNQIGFTTDPAAGRSSPYCSDMAKMIDAPVIHVNGDDPQICTRAAALAMEYRQRFHKDIVIDLWCYRRHGHNEGDEPMFTQPRMYTKIANHPHTCDIYTKHLIEEGSISAEQSDAMSKKFYQKLEQEFQDASQYNGSGADWLEGQWSDIAMADNGPRRGKTGVPLDFLKEIGNSITTLPDNLNANSKVIKIFEQRKQAIQSGEGIDWSTAESLAFASLLCESNSIRLSGEDCGRGTFSQRHSVIKDQQDEHSYIPLNNIRSGQALFGVIDSPLSEFGLLGFEYGFASAEPHALVIWEAQFGDFANGAQVIIDQFIASGETKWLRMCGLVLLLPHGYEGQGPEHSSARLERYLQLCAQDNMQVCNITTPSNYFHALRRQLRRDFRKPLIIMSPKSLLRHKLCKSKLEEMSIESSFHRILWDDRELAAESSLVEDKKIRRVVLCSGKIYFDLLIYAQEQNVNDVYIMRVEQLYPLPVDGLLQELKRFPNGEIVWCQEEPKNAGAWGFVDRQIEDISQDIKGKSSRPRYIGREASASPAVGSLKLHNAQQKKIIEEAFS